MGKANIISHIADGQYTAEILYDETQMQAQIDAVVQALTLVGEQITEAAASIVTLESQLAQQKETLRLRVLAWRTLLDEQPALEDAVEARADELETLEEELQRLKDAGAEQFFIDSKQAEVDAKELELQQAQSDLSVNKSHISAIRTEIDGLYDTTAKTKAQLTLAEGKHGNLILRQAALDARLLALDANSPPEDIRDIWCADLTEDLTGEWPTLDIPGESELILLAPEEYVDEHNLHATTTSQFAPVVAMSPAQAAFNFAIHPGWQRHKPTYRVGVITAIDTTEDTASVTLDAANSRYQNLNVNEATFLADIDVVYMSCNASAFEVDDRVVVEFPYQIPSEQHLQQTISNLAAAHSTALAFKTELEARLAEVEADKTEAEADRDSLSAQLSDQMSADPVDLTAIEITLAQQVVNGALVTRLIQKQIFTDQAISAVTAKIQRIQTAFDDATALAAVYPGPRVIGFETEPQACENYYIALYCRGFYTLLRVKKDEVEIAKDKDGNKIEKKQGYYLSEFPEDDFIIDDEEFDWFIDYRSCSTPSMSGCNYNYNSASCLDSGEVNIATCSYDTHDTYDSNSRCTGSPYDGYPEDPDAIGGWIWPYLEFNRADRPWEREILEDTESENFWWGTDIEIIYDIHEEIISLEKVNETYAYSGYGESSHVCGVAPNDRRKQSGGGSATETSSYTCSLTDSTAYWSSERVMGNDGDYSWFARNSNFLPDGPQPGCYQWSYVTFRRNGKRGVSTINSVRGNSFGLAILHAQDTDYTFHFNAMNEYGEGGSPVGPIPQVNPDGTYSLLALKAYYKFKPPDPEIENDPAIKEESFPYPENAALAQAATDLYHHANAGYPTNWSGSRVNTWAFKATPKPEEEEEP